MIEALIVAAYICINLIWNTYYREEIKGKLIRFRIPKSVKYSDRKTPIFKLRPPTRTISSYYVLEMFSIRYGIHSKLIDFLLMVLIPVPIIIESYKYHKHEFVAQYLTDDDLLNAIPQTDELELEWCRQHDIKYEDKNRALSQKKQRNDTLNKYNKQFNDNYLS